MGEFVEQGNAAEGCAINALVEFELKVSTTAKDGFGEVGKFGFVETPPDASFAGVEFLAKEAVALAATFALAGRGLSV